MPHRHWLLSLLNNNIDHEKQKCYQMLTNPNKCDQIQTNVSESKQMRTGI